MSIQCSKTSADVLVLDSFFLKKVAEEFTVAQQKNVRRLPAPMDEILRFAQVARKKLSVDDLFSYQYFLLPFCDRCATVGNCGLLWAVAFYP